MRWRPLSKYSPKPFWKFCITRCSMLGEIAANSSLMFCFKSTVVLGFFSCTFALEISSEEEVLRLGTLVPMNIEVPTKYSLSQNRIVVFEIRLHSKSPMLYRPALHGNWNALSLARRALKDKFSTPTVPLRLFCKIVKYFCRTLYIYTDTLYYFLYQKNSSNFLTNINARIFDKFSILIFQKSGFNTLTSQVT